MFEKIISYFFPKIIYETDSKINEKLEVCYINGTLVLDSKNTNYSYGNLQKVLAKGLEKIGKNKILQCKNILLLGVGAGSVIETLTQKYKYNYKIIGIELDQKVIEIAKNYFNIDQFKNVDLINYNAFDFVLETKLTFDFIIIDVFQDDKMPNFLFETFYTNKINEILNGNGIILFNTMILNKNDRIRNENFIKNNYSIFNIYSLKNIENYNELIFLEKK